MAMKFGSTHPREQEVFLDASDLNDPLERERYLDEVCGSDVFLKKRVLALLEIDPMESELRAPSWVADAVRDVAEEGDVIPTEWVPPSAEELQKVLSAYRVEEMIGRGGMGAVYRAVQRSLERTVAIKILQSEVGVDAEFPKRFRREALALARLDHPAIVTIYDYGQVDLDDSMIYFIVMEYVDGSDLRKFTSGKDSMDFENVIRVISEACGALQTAHSMGFVHRDIKPGNLLLKENDQVKVCDLGLAKLVSQSVSGAEVSRLTITGYIIGTPQYLAPEILDDASRVDHRADIYGLGVVLYQLLTGKLPRGTFTMPAKVRERDTRIDEVVKKALQSNPDRRYQTMTEMKEALDDVLRPSSGFDWMIEKIFGKRSR